MALLLSKVHTDTIRLVGRCCSDIMMRYLHMSAHTFTSGMTVRMVKHGDYALIPPAHGG